ncbi:MAG TPA: cytochrome c biogenesis protein CcsA [Candidatus Hydrogenedentes bacterium]|nr:cytochrome c biogenesis protein CcsA [Candidatus Hydrogenedentota bacterium]HNT87233.1 cytochrome c biogenesis protein CcsA [Candidatus Hydrogenedentota bacterium]
MHGAIYGVLYAGVACYVGAAALSFWYLREETAVRLRAAARLMAIGAVLLASALVLRLVHSRLLPMTSPTDSLMLFVLMGTATGGAVARAEKRRALLCFYVPPLAAIALIGAYTARADYRVAPEHLTTVLLAVHVTLAMLAYALFLLASLTSLAYVFQAGRLKRRHTTGLFLKLPSLEELDHTLYLLIRYGYPLFVITLWLGLSWAWYDSSPLSDTWWLSPKIVLSLVMALLYSFSYHARARGWLRGPKLAYCVFLAFGFLLCAYLVLNVLGLTNYNFRGGAV